MLIIVTVKIRQKSILEKAHNKAQAWWVVGNQGGDSVTLFAASPLTETNFDERTSVSDYIKTYSTEWGCSYPEGQNIESVHVNHYGASMLRDELKTWTDTYDGHFGDTEKALMLDTTIYTDDEKNNCVYSTKDKLYLPYGEKAEGAQVSHITVGRNAPDNLNNGLHIDVGYWYYDPVTNSPFWLRPPSTSKGVVMTGKNGSTTSAKWITGMSVNNAENVLPAFELDLTSVIFASAAGTTRGAIEGSDPLRLRLDGSDKKIGTVSYDAEAGKIVAQKDEGAGRTVTLFVQFNQNGTRDTYYSIPVTTNTVVTEEMIKKEFGKNIDLDFAECKIWLEKTEDNVTYAKMAEAKKINIINSVELTGVKPENGKAFPTKASCNTEGIDAESLAITYTAKDSSEEATGNADWNKTYQAELTLALDKSGDAVCIFGDSPSVTVDGDTAQQCTLNTDGTLTVTKEFTTAKKKITGVAAPAVPKDNIFTEYYTADSILADNSELGGQAELTLEGNASSDTVKANVTWMLANDGGAAYNTVPETANTFRWTVKASEIANYDASECEGYDSKTGSITGTVTISNKDAAPVTLTGNDQTLTYDGSAIDVSNYFSIDENAGKATYSLVSKEDDGTVTGEGTLDGTVLTVTKPGVFRVTLTTAANGNYAAGEKTITVTVNYCSEAVTLAPGKIVMRVDETIKNSTGGIVTIDNGNDGTTDVTVTLPRAGSVEIDENGRLTVLSTRHSLTAPYLRLESSKACFTFLLNSSYSMFLFEGTQTRAL